MDFTPIEAALLNRIQRDFPMSEDPFAGIAGELCVETDTLIATVKNLKDRGVIRSISALFNQERLGYASSLVAFQVDGSEADRAASVISAHPGVSHNYLRDHRYNLWFTLSSETGEKLRKTVAILAGRTGAKDHLLIRNERLVKIGMVLPVGEAGPLSTDTAGASNRPVTADARPLTDDQKEAVRLLQVDLPLERRPFARLVQGESGRLDERSLIVQAIAMKESGIMRRYAAVLRHRAAGYSANAMTVWRPESTDVMERAIREFSKEPAITHCYLRSVYPGRWEYPLFAMLHARSDEELDGLVALLASRSGVRDYLVLRSLREYKKERVVYFSPSFGEWERMAGL